MNENSKVGTSSLQSGKTLTSLIGNTAIPSSLGTTVTGAINSLASRGGSFAPTAVYFPNKAVTGSWTVLSRYTELKSTFSFAL